MTLKSQTETHPVATRVMTRKERKTTCLPPQRTSEKSVRLERPGQLLFWLILFVMGLTHCTVIVTFGWGVKSANSGFCHGHSRFGGGHGISPYTKRESQPLGLILRCSRGHGSTDFGGSRVG